MLSEKEKKFAYEYIKSGCTAYQAAMAAGYKDSTSKYANEWITETLNNSTTKRHLPYKPDLHDYIKNMASKKEASNIADVNEALEYLTSVLRGEARQEDIYVVGTGNGFAETQKVERPPTIKERKDAANIFVKINGLEKNSLTLDISPIVINNDIVE